MEKLFSKVWIKIAVIIVLIFLSAYKITQGLHWDETLSIAIGDMTAKGNNYLSQTGLLCNSHQLYSHP